VVTDIRLESRTGLEAVWRMSLDRTEFGAGDTGKIEAVTRSGTRLEIPVTSVVVDEGRRGVARRGEAAGGGNGCTGLCRVGAWSGACAHGDDDDWAREELKDACEALFPKL